MTEPDPSGGRVEADDYDLLTYGEAAARLAELLAAEELKLAALRQQGDPDRAAVEQLEQRIALLKSSDARYRQLSLSAEAFTERFGFSPNDEQKQNRQ